MTTLIETISFITLILDTVGRKKPLMFGAGSFIVTYSVLTAIVACFPPGVSENHPAQKAGIAMIFMTSIFFSLSFGPVSWVLASEVLYDTNGFTRVHADGSQVFPTKTRSIGTSVATCANWALNVLFSQVCSSSTSQLYDILNISKVSNLAIANISWKYYLVFICLNTVDFVVITLFFPETKGASSKIADVSCSLNTPCYREDVGTDG